MEMAMSDERLEIEKIAPSDETSLIRPGYPRLQTYPDGYGTSYGYGEDEGIHLRDIWRTIRKRKWLILVIAVIVTSIVTVEAFRTKSIYMASAMIELGKENTTMVKSGNGDVVIQTDDTDLYYPLMSIKTKMLRLTSEPLLEDVVVNLKLDQNPRFLDVGQKKSFWEALDTIRARFGGPKSEEPAVSNIDTSAIAAGSGDLTRSPEESERLAPFVGILAGNLGVEQIKETRALKVTFTHTDPAIAYAVANGVAQDFIERSFQSKTEKFTNASNWLDRTTRDLKSKVEQAEQALANYTREHNIFSTEGKETLTTDKLSRLHDQATRAETERILKQSLYDEVKQGRVAELPAAFADQKLTGLQAKLDELQSTADKLDLQYGPDNPMVVEVKQQIKSTHSQIEAGCRSLEMKLKGEYELAMRDEQALKSALATAKGEAVQQNQDAIQYNILKQEVDTAKAMYTDFLQKTNQAKVEVAQQHNNLKLIQPARIPRSAIGPARVQTVMAGFFLSLAAGIGLAFFLEYLDSTIKTVEDVGRYVRLPALGVIPAIAAKSTKRLSGQKRLEQISTSMKERGLQLPYSTSLVLDTRSSAAEAYRVLRTSMLLSAAGHPPRTILVTSAQAGEGKTTTAVNTAISLAQLGARVLIIDCDLRRPSAHKFFDVDPLKGLSSYLSRDTDLDVLVHRTGIANLSLLPCGAIPPNPAELISSEKMRSMLSILTERYDHILIDSPPLLNVTDPVILSTMVDGVILVVHGGKSTRAVARRARQELAVVGAKIFGVVLNNLDLRREGYDQYYYSRYYSTYGQPREEAVNR
jgi:polysaccharide biosynthesis transport protein